MAPPQLAADAPGPDALHPLEKAPLLPLGYDRGFPILDGLNGRVGKRLHIEEPLGTDARLDRGIAALAVRHRVLVRLDLEQQSLPLKVAHDGLAALLTIHPGVGPG